MSEKEEVSREQIGDTLKSINEALINSKLPTKMKGEIKEEYEELKTFILDARPARIAIVGRRGAGKSSLINAIFGEMRAEIGDVKAQTGIGKWYTYESDLGALEILDTRGLGEGDKPEEHISKDTSLEEVKASIRQTTPDAILFLSKAKDVSSRIDEDMDNLLELKKMIQAEYEYDVPIIGLVTQVDELSPKSVAQPPFDHEVKQKNIADAVEMLSTKLRDTVSAPVTVIPICCYLEFVDNEIEYDIRWNVDALLDYLIEKLPKEAQMILAKLSKVKSVQRKIAKRIGASVAAITATVGAAPIPLADLPVITGLQVVMVTTIAMISGRKANKKTVFEFFGALGINVGVGFAFRTIARQLVRIIPVAGNAVSGIIASAGTYALCEAAIVYFIDGKSIDSVKETYKSVFFKKKAPINLEETEEYTESDTEKAEQ